MGTGTEASGRQAAERLRAERDRIVALWMERVRAQVPAARVQDEPALMDTLPVVLDELAEWMAGERSDGEQRMHETVLARGHGLIRAALAEYRLDAVMHEYAVLREVLFDMLEEDGPLGPTMRRVLLDFVQLSMRTAANEFLRHKELARQASEKAAREASALVSSQKRLYEAMLDATDDHVFVVDPEGRFRFINRAAARDMGLAPEAIVGRSGEELALAPDFLARTEERMEEAFRGRQVVHEAPLPTRRGLRHFEIALSPLLRPDGSVEAVVGVARDIHERTLIHARLNEERALREQFVASITHDLRSPLTAAKVSAETLLRSGAREPRDHRLVTRILDTIGRANGMIQDLLDATRIRAGEPLHLQVAPCDLRLVLEHTVDELSLVHGERFRVQLSGQLQGLWSAGDLRRVVENLAVNAIKYGADERPITIRARGADGTVEIAVHNEGNPIPPADLPQLFQPLQRTHSAQTSGQAGWGIGLALVRALAEAHGGGVRVESSAEAGTTFTVTLPMQPPRAAS